MPACTPKLLVLLPDAAGPVKSPIRPTVMVWPEEPLTLLVRLGPELLHPAPTNAARTIVITNRCIDTRNPPWRCLWAFDIYRIGSQPDIVRLHRQPGFRHQIRGPGAGVLERDYVRPRARASLMAWASMSSRRSTPGTILRSAREPMRGTATTSSPARRRTQPPSSERKSK
jgi:hypothetical protein